jgi:hypothetical protein
MESDHKRGRVEVIFSYPHKMNVDCICRIRTYLTDLLSVPVCVCECHHYAFLFLCRMFKSGIWTSVWYKFNEINLQYEENKCMSAVQRRSESAQQINNSIRYHAVFASCTLQFFFSEFSALRLLLETWVRNNIQDLSICKHIIFFFINFPIYLQS